MNKGKEIKNVTWVRNAGLCMGCGSCAAVCPIKGAITVELDEKYGEFLPVVNLQICTQCAMCVSVCPGLSVDIEGLSQEFLDGTKYDNLLGNYEQIYLGYAADQSIRKNASSGGLVSALLIHALNEKMIDGALVLGMSSEHPLETVPFIARTPEEILSACGSKYCPSAINLGLQEIIKNPGRFAVVGLPCYLHSVRKMELLKPSLRQKIVLHLGLFCANNNTVWGTRYFLDQNHIKADEVREISYRWGGWPGKIRVVLKDGSEKIIARGTSETSFVRRALFSSAFHYDFSLRRCLLCPDQASELSDVSFADPWLKELRKTEQTGQSMVVVRNQVGSQLILNAIEKGDMIGKTFPLSLARRAQNYNFKKGAGGRIKFRSFFGKPVPNYGNREMKSSWLDSLSTIYYLPVYFSRRMSLWPFLRINAILRAYYRQLVGRMTPLLKKPELNFPAPSKTPGTTNILFIGAPITDNLGGPSLLLSTMAVLDKVFTNPHYTLLSPSSSDLDLAKQYRVEIIPVISAHHRVFFSACLQAFMHIPFNFPAGVADILRIYREADVIIDIWGIIFTDALRTDKLLSRLIEGLHLLLGRILKKPVIKYTADFGPIKTRWNRFFARFYLQNTTNYIMARSEESRQILRDIGVTTAIDVYPDTAFLLEPTSYGLAEELAAEKEAPIGICVSFQSGKQSGNPEQYKILMAKFADYVIEYTGRRMVFVPNELSQKSEKDDLHTSLEVHRLMKNQQKAIVVQEKISAPELKSILKTCEAIVSSRYHTIVAGLSLGIPVLAVGWHHKYDAILSLLGQEKYSWIVNFDDEATLYVKFVELWDNRQLIHQEINHKLPGVKESVLAGGRKVAEIVKNFRK
jgi:coenzyme F420 hydrogenase subunit beta